MKYIKIIQCFDIETKSYCLYGEAWNWDQSMNLRLAKMFVVGVMIGIPYFLGKRHQAVKGLSTTQQEV